MQKIIVFAAMLSAIAAQADTSLFPLAGTKSPVPVLSPGTKMNIGGRLGGKVVVVWGDDACPNREPPPDGCLVKNKPAVTAHWLDAGRTITEQWAVVKKGDGMYLARPDGTLIAQAD